MTIFHAALLGLVQGFTEFLPVSSDGHLVLTNLLFDIPLNGRDALGFDILLHAGSLVAILIAYFAIWKKLVLSALRGERDAWILIGLLVVATIPGVIAGLLFEDGVSELRSLRAAGIGFIVTGSVLIAGEAIGKMRNASEMRMEKIGVIRALLIGCAQAIAILPGVSRSGCTISTARALGLERRTALDFSFLMALPIIGGAVAKTLLDALQGTVAFPAAAVSVTGLAVSFVVSMAAITLLKRLVVKRSLAVFSWYVLPLGALLLIADVAGW